VNASPATEHQSVPVTAESLNTERPSRRWIADLIALLFIAIIGFKFTWHAALASDINLSDECWYALAGYDLSKDGPPPACFSPLYALWYGAFTDIQPDPLVLQIWNWRFLVTSLGILVYLITRRAGVSPMIALLASCWLIASNLMSVWPYPTYFVTVMAGICCFIAMYFRSAWYQVALIASTLGIASFVRPEMLVAQVAVVGSLSLAMVAAYFFGKLTLRRAALTMAVALVPVALLAATFGNPLAGGRSEIAFGQHYSLNKSEAGLIQINPWVNWESIVSEDFGSACSPSQALLRNPKAMIWHMNRNLSNAWDSFCKLAKLNLHAATLKAISLYFVLGLLAISFLAFCRRDFARQLADIARRLFVPICTVAAIGVPVAIACTLIYPRDHYLFPIVFFLIIVVTILIGRMSWLNSALISRPLALAVAGMVMIVAVPNVAHRWSMRPLLAWENDLKPTFPNRQSIADIKGAPIRGPVRIVEGALLYRMALPKADVKMLSMWETKKSKSFADYLRQHDVNVVIANKNLEVCAWIANDPTYTQLRDDPAGDFVQWKAGTGDLKVLIRRDALSSDATKPIALSNSTR